MMKLKVFVCTIGLLLAVINCTAGGEMKDAYMNCSKDSMKLSQCCNVPELMTLKKFEHCTKEVCPIDCSLKEAIQGKSVTREGLIKFLKEVFEEAKLTEIGTKASEITDTCLNFMKKYEKVKLPKLKGTNCDTTNMILSLCLFKSSANFCPDRAWTKTPECEAAKAGVAKCQKMVSM